VDTRWLVSQEPDSDAEFRLFCFPYAGGSASIYRAWHRLAPGHIQVCAVELPGRGKRLDETPFLRAPSLVRALAEAIQPALDRPFAFFGHSMGGLLAFELARALRDRGCPQPAHLFISATATPGTRPTRGSLNCPTDAEMLDELRALKGTPQELLDNEELMALALPMLRADYSVLGTYEYRPAPPLAVPLTVLGATSDWLVPPSALSGWRKQTTAGTRHQLFPGDHFFINSAGAEVMEIVSRTLIPSGIARDLVDSWD
jgi:surfactin synthase thioesterase subunit